MENKKKKRQREFDKPLPKPTFVTSTYLRGYCDRIHLGVRVRCEHNYQCHLCDLAYRTALTYRVNPPHYPVLTADGVLGSGRGKGYSYYNKIVAVKEETLEKHDRKSTLYFQLFKCDDGYGCLPGNDVWEVDGYFISHPDKPVTLQRSDILGIPSFNECRKIDRQFFLNTVAECGYLEGGGDKI